MRQRRLVVSVVALLLTGCASDAPAEVVTQDARYTDTIALPPPDETGARPLEEVLARRRSVREFDDEPLPMEIVGQLLWAAQGVTDDAGHRTAPSAGARYPIEVYAVTATEVMHYLPERHAVESRVDERAARRLAASSFGQGVIAEAPVVLVITGVVARTRVEYGAVADELMNREAGHVAQNVLLQATALDLASVPVGGFDPVDASRALALPQGEEVLYLVPVGTR